VSRFLARALAMLAAAGPGVGFGDFGGFGDRVGSENSLPPAGPLPGVAVVEADPSPPWCPPAPIAPLPCYWPGVRLAELEAEGAVMTPCSHGGQNWERPDGRAAWFSRAVMLRLRAAGQGTTSRAPDSLHARPCGRGSLLAGFN